MAFARRLLNEIVSASHPGLRPRLTNDQLGEGIISAEGEDHKRYVFLSWHGPGLMPFKATPRHDLWFYQREVQGIYTPLPRGCS